MKIVPAITCALFISSEEELVELEDEPDYCDEDFVLLPSSSDADLTDEDSDEEEEGQDVRTIRNISMV